MFYFLLKSNTTIMKKNTYHLITFYKFVDITYPQQEVKAHANFCKDIGMKGRIYIGEEGISATATCNPGQLLAYKLYLRQSAYFSDVEDQIDDKISLVHQHMFDKMIVKYRSEIVTLGKVIDQKSFTQSLQDLPPEELKSIIEEENKDRVILDMRNSYEYKL